MRVNNVTLDAGQVEVVMADLAALLAAEPDSQEPIVAEVPLDPGAVGQVAPSLPAMLAAQHGVPADVDMDPMAQASGEFQWGQQEYLKGDYGKAAGSFLSANRQYPSEDARYNAAVSGLADQMKQEFRQAALAEELAALEDELDEDDLFVLEPQQSLASRGPVK